MTSDDLNRKFIHAPKFFVILSLLLHFSVVLIWGTGRILEDMGFHLFGLNNQRIPIREVYQEFIQVDVVALPDELISEKDTIDATQEINETAPVQAVKPEEETPIENSQEDVMAELEEKKKAEAEAKKQEEAERVAKEKAEKAKEARLKEREEAMRQLEKETKRADALKALEETSRKELRGNILSKGTSTRGNIGAAKDLYRSLLAQRIKREFNIFAWQQKRDLVAVIYIRINDKGKVTEKKVVKASSDPLFDSAVLDAIDKSQPFPVSREASIMEEGVSIEFRPSQ